MFIFQACAVQCQRCQIDANDATTLSQAAVLVAIAHVSHDSQSSSRTIILFTFKHALTNLLNFGECLGILLLFVGR